ncbi:MAG: metallophosphoesterase [Melioribacteraceae bacterium]|nr:metallophosphoesterase [Melioribacteraceae bacterium]MCF8356632.1 metallophosphoesterase [Melioribacteraceae bacterium]MCF8396010.1 metallophosphoesterase [Melioribacteraceae bacterium]MCF8421041.1 metallophosphoesterase [Melioribacteraceae bacterium]
MKLASFLIFISIVLVIYGSVNYYIFSRGIQAIPKDSPVRTYYIALFIFFALSFWVGRISENFMINSLTDTLVWIGSFWLAAILYFFLFAALFDLLRAVNHFAGIFPQAVMLNYEKYKFYSLIGVVVITGITLIYGYVNFLNPRTFEMTISVPKKESKIEQLNIAVASDIHLGTIVRNSQLDNLVEKINGMNPDIILLPGDIIDEDLGPVLKLNLGEKLKKLKAKYGVYGVAGNHEYIGGVNEAVKYLEDHGIKMLLDSSVFIDSSFYITGRKDKAVTNFTSGGRLNLAELAGMIDKNYPAILMDHQPFDLHLAEENGYDLQLSGHTHHGQLFPLNFVTSMIYELSWGYLQKGNTHYYVSSGFAGWGPPVRTGSRTEIVNIVLKFE